MRSRSWLTIMAALWFLNVDAERRAPSTAAADKECKGADWTACGRHTLALIWLEWHSATRSRHSRKFAPTWASAVLVASASCRCRGRRATWTVDVGMEGTRMATAWPESAPARARRGLPGFVGPLRLLTEKTQKFLRLESELWSRYRHALGLQEDLVAAASRHQKQLHHGFAW